MSENCVLVSGLNRQCLSPLMGVDLTTHLGVNDWLVTLFGFASGILGPVTIYYAIVSWTPLDWVFNGYKNSKFRAKSAVMNKLARYF